MKYVPHPYQQKSFSWMIKRLLIDEHKGAALFFDPGLGKTSTTLLFLRLLSEIYTDQRVLIVAPLRVIYSVWPEEITKWDQFKGLSYSIVHGGEPKRIKNLECEADIYLINPEGVPWLATHLAKTNGFKFSTLVVDESTKFKSWSSKRTKALRAMAPLFQRRLILTGTPSPDSVADLFAQIWLLDEGESLGENITQFRKRYFYRGGYGNYQWLPIDTAAKSIEKLIAPLVMRLASEDYLDLPEMIYNDIKVELPKPVLKTYKKLERDMFIELEDATSVTASNAGAKYVACRQLASGGVYDEDRNPIELHSAKVDAVEDIFDELSGKPLLVPYAYIHELDRLKQRFSCESISGATKPKDADKLINQWNAGGLKMLAVQPKSLSHGINMQAGPGRDICWFTLPDSLEEYQQLNKRIHRQGVRGDVRIHHLLAKGTVDSVVINRLRNKDKNQSSLLDALNQYRAEHGS